MIGLAARAFLRAQAEADTDGVMVALVPPAEVSKQLLEASDGDEPLDGQHITLVYLGDRADVDRDVLNRAVYQFCRSGQSALSGRVNGWGVFNPPDGGGVLVALWDVPGLAALRTRLVDVLVSAGIDMPSEHDFTAHETMRYSDDPITELPDPVDLEADFGVLVVSYGDDHQSWPLLPLSTQADFDPGEHPRGGDPKNPGEFSTKPGSGAPKLPSMTSPPKAIIPKPTTAPPKAMLPRVQPVRSREDMIAKGDVFQKLLPKGKYDEGDPRNDPEYEHIDQQKTSLLHRYAGVSREDIAKAESDHKDPETIRRMRIAQRASRKDRANGLGGGTNELYDRLPDPKTGAHDVYLPARADVHDKILRDLDKQAEKVPHAGKCLVLAGPPGSGKSSFLRSEGARLGVKQTDGVPTNYVTLNPDDFKDKLPVDMDRYPGLKPNEIAFLKHEESSYLCKRAVARLMSKGVNVILDVTLADAKSAVDKYVKPYGDKYDYQVALVDGDISNSYHNAGLRYKALDKVTGQRTYGGRYLPTSLIAGQKPTKSGYRSKNAQEFEVFAKDPHVSHAFSYDPYTKALTVRKGTKLSATLRGTHIATERKMQTTEITDRIREFGQGKINRGQLVHYLTEQVRYTKPVDRTTIGHPDRYHKIEGGTEYLPGSFDEVTRAHDVGELPHAVYREVADKLARRAHG